VIERSKVAQQATIALLLVRSQLLLVAEARFRPAASVSAKIELISCLCAPLVPLAEAHPLRKNNDYTDGAQILERTEPRKEKTDPSWTVLIQGKVAS
jgi:hypothetical protein